MAEKVIVVAPTIDIMARWCDEHQIGLSNVIPIVDGLAAQNKLQGTQGLPHVILCWSWFTEADRDMIRAYLEITHSVPFEEYDGELRGADPVRG